MSAPAFNVSDELLAQQMLGAVASAIYEAINRFSDPDQLHETARFLWKAYAAGELSDGEANYLQFLIDRRRPLRRMALHAKPLGKFAGRLCGRFTPRQRQRSPDRQASRDRRRMLGGSSALPDNLRHHYTEGQRSVLCIVAGEVKRCGVCDFPIDKIAALAGVCRTTVQTTLHEARRLGHIKITERPQPGRKNLPNLVEIIPPEWRIWIRRGPSAARRIGSNSAKMVNPTKNTDLRKRVAEEQIRTEWSPSAGPLPLTRLGKRMTASNDARLSGGERNQGVTSRTAFDRPERDTRVAPDHDTKDNRNDAGGERVRSWMRWCEDAKGLYRRS
jgi:hypothetical protein